MKISKNGLQAESRGFGVRFKGGCALEPVRQVF